MICRHSWGVSSMGCLSLGIALAGCGEGVDAAGPQPELGTTEQAITACAGDDANYDFNALAASLAVAVADELGRWDATAEFVLLNPGARPRSSASDIPPA